jgi:hypothetical protein
VKHVALPGAPELSLVIVRNGVAMQLTSKSRSAFVVGGVGAGFGLVLGATLLGCSSDPDGGALVGPARDAKGESIDGVPEQVELPLSPGAVTGSPDPSGVVEPTGLLGFVDDMPEQDSSCAEQLVPTTARRPVIQFVVDTSGSMNWVAGTERNPEAGEQSKWQITQQALATAIDGMPDAVAVGISYYPNAEGSDAACYQSLVAAPIAPLSTAHRELIGRVNAAQAARGGTPTHAAYEFGVEQLETSDLDGSRFLVLMTDGIPTFTRDCGGDGRARVDGAPLVGSVGERFRQADVRTFVIGAPGSEAAREELSEMALAGGTGASGCNHAGPESCHFDMTSEPDFSRALNQALGEIVDATLACDYAVPAPPLGQGLDYDDVTVVLESEGAQVMEFAPAASGACDAGWRYNDDRTSIRLCSSTCDELAALVSADPGIAVRVKFGCRIIPR